MEGAAHGSEESLPFCPVANRLLVRKRFGQKFSFAHFQEDILENTLLEWLFAKALMNRLSLNGAGTFIVNTKCCKVLCI